MSKVVSINYFAFLLLLSFNPLITKAQQTPTFVGSNCQNSTKTPLSKAYKSNLNSILTWFASDAATSDGYNHTIIGNTTTSDADAVYGLYVCRGDVDRNFCQFCVSSATKEVPLRCLYSVSGMVWYDFCIVRYSNENFFGKVLTNPTWHYVGTKNVTKSEEIQKGEDFLRSLIRKATKETNQLFYMDGFNLSSTERRYGLVQCSRDLTNEGCNQCAEALLEQVSKCCEKNLGWQIWSGSCVIKYDDQMFYLLNNQTSTIPTSTIPVPNLPKANQGGNRSRRSKNLIIVFSVMGLIIPLCFSVYWFFCRNRVRKDVRAEETLNTDLPTITLITILQSTKNFSETSKLGEGGFGPVYKGTLPDGRQIAVKRLSKTKASGQGLEEFMNEVMLIAKLQHRNLVRLLACCLEENEMILVYEYMSNLSLNFHLFDEEKKKQLDWKLRLSIINGIAKGLSYLHEDSRLKVIHRDLKASNILLDNEMNPKIADFGLARAFERGQNQANTNRVVGTYGYMAPEYAMGGLFSVKSDVFSFGVIVLEIISGGKNSGFYQQEHGQCLLFHAWNLWCAGKCLEFMDPVLENSCVASEVEKCIHIGLLCVQQEAVHRPTMSNVLVMLASDTVVLPRPKEPAFSVGKMTLEEASTSKGPNNIPIYDVTITISPR